MSTAPDSPEKLWMLATLKELAEIGMEQARQLAAEERPAGEAAAGQAALRYSRISRAVRQTVGLYGLVLEDKLGEAAGRSRAGAGGPKPPSQKDIDEGARVRTSAVFNAKGLIERLAPLEAIDVFEAEMDEWREDARFNHLYADADRMEATAEIFMMLGLTLPPGWIYDEEFQKLADEHAAGKHQPWREAWEFLAGRERPHLALCEDWKPIEGRLPWRFDRDPDQAEDP